MHEPIPMFSQHENCFQLTIQIKQNIKKKKNWCFFSCLSLILIPFVHFTIRAVQRSSTVIIITNGNNKRHTIRGKKKPKKQKQRSPRNELFYTQFVHGVVCAEERPRHNGMKKKSRKNTKKNGA